MGELMTNLPFSRYPGSVADDGSGRGTPLFLPALAALARLLPFQEFLKQLLAILGRERGRGLARGYEVVELRALGGARRLHLHRRAVLLQPFLGRLLAGSPGRFPSGGGLFPFLW